MSATADDLTLSQADDEYPHPTRDTPLWSENYAWVSYDATSQIGLFIHIGRAPHNPSLWRGTTVALLPGGEHLVSKTLGAGVDPRQPGNTTLHGECEEPTVRWRLRHDGPALRTTRDAVSTRLVHDGEPATLTYDVTFEQLHPVWDLTDWMREQAWGHAHIEQGGTLKGTVTVDGVEHRYDAVGIRDHTLGPRNFASLNRTCWAFAAFPSGRVACALRVWSPDDDVVLDKGYVYVDGEMRFSEPGELPTVTSADGAPHDFHIEVGGERITGEVQTSTAFMLEEPNDLLVGTDPGREDMKVIVEAPCKYTWGDEVGHGWLERSRRIDQL
ncbi:MAG: hypothetical protein QOF76_1974 [Solirubrobacteraceae bacterium]|jgi:hypothetical protein|nr:hypothetical protein [Solirubrobacteraceae bacterium]